MKVLKKHGILYKSDVSPNLHILYTRVLHCNKCLCERKSWRMHGCWCTRKHVIKVQCKECGHSRMGTISLYPCQGTCYKEAALVTDSSATPTSTQFVWWSPPSPSSSSPAAAEVLGCATHCVVMIPTHSGTGLALVISTISKLPQWTDSRLKVSWRIRIWTFTHFCLTRPILSSSHPLPRIPIFLNCPLKRPLNLPPMVLPSSSSWLPRDFPGRSILHSSRISPSPARCCWWCPNIHIHATHIHPSSQKQLIPHLKSHCLHTPTQCTKWMYHLMKGFSLRGSSFFIEWRPKILLNRLTLPNGELYSFPSCPCCLRAFNVHVHLRFRGVCAP